MFHFQSDKRGLILKSALEVFMTYGFRKTSMDDIARAAGVSRPALYQVFANKMDIFRALAMEMMDKAVADAATAFDDDVPLREQLYNSIDRSIMEIHRFIERTPHGLELMGVHEELGADIEERWGLAMTQTVARGIEKALAAGQAHIPPHLRASGMGAEAVATVFMQAIEGTKRDYVAGRQIDAHVANISRLVAASIGAND